MKKKWIIILAFVLTLLLSSGVAIAANENPDYISGYVAAQEFYATSTEKYDYTFAFYIYLNQGRVDEEIIKNYSRRVQYEEGFRQGYKDADEGSPPDVNYAENMGKSLGEQYAARDYYDGMISSFSRAMPSDSAIIFRYNLGKLQIDYRENFILEFKNNFQMGYIDKYEELLLKSKLDSFQQGLSDGQSMGDAVGRIFAQRDYFNKLAMNYQRNLLTDEQIRTQYRLSLHNVTSPEYADAFVQGYKMGYQYGYIEEYRAKANEDYSSLLGNFVVTPAGGEVATPGGEVVMNFLPGTYYRDAMVIVENKLNSVYNTREYIRASDVYDVTISNPAGTFDKTKYVKISMPYHSDGYQAGIYKLVGGRWMYMPSFEEGDSIYTMVRIDTIDSKTSTFALFKDENVRVITDIRSHWARPEIETMIRRGVITGYPDGRFRPDQNITRAEFLTLLSRLNSWVLPSESTQLLNTRYFSDYQSFSSYDRVISYGRTMNYIFGYPDRSFKPNNNITYREIQWIMDRVIRTENFKWSDIATQLQYEKTFKSPGLTNLDLRITRAEVAYMLYKVYEWRY